MKNLKLISNSLILLSCCSYVSVYASDINAVEDSSCKTNTAHLVEINQSLIKLQEINLKLMEQMKTIKKENQKSTM